MPYLSTNTLSVSRKLMEDMRFLGQRQWTLLFTATAVTKVSALPEPQFPNGDAKWTSWHLHV